VAVGRHTILRDTDDPMGHLVVHRRCPLGRTAACRGVPRRGLSSQISEGASRLRIKCVIMTLYHAILT
jgi:hypothetical protein